MIKLSKNTGQSLGKRSLKSGAKYIEKQFRKELDLKGVPIKIFYKTDDNPFKDKKNKLTERQLKKRARIRRH